MIIQQTHRFTMYNQTKNKVNTLPNTKRYFTVLQCICKSVSQLGKGRKEKKECKREGHK